MSREILFKAKVMDSKGRLAEESWVEGYYAEMGTEENIKHYIIQNGALLKLFEKEEDNMCFIDVEVDPETNCRYTGLTDKYNNKIWENDICTVAGEDGYFIVEWDNDTARFVLNGGGLTVDFDNFYGYECEVIGNVFDDPELLGREERNEWD